MAAEPEGGAGLARAFDELRFGASRTLNLRAMQPTATQASAHAEQWLRRLQVEGAGEALVITGRGLRSVNGFSPVREAIVRLLPSLRRRNVISGYAEHTPGSFVVTFASVTQLLEAPRRRRERRTGQGRSDTPVPMPTTLAALEPDTQRQLRDLAQLALAVLGVLSPTPAQLDDEMQRQFAVLSAALPAGGDQEALLQQALQRAADEYDQQH